ncbi:hypothetical protein D3C81_1499260 [compost metagenome]
MRITWLSTDAGRIAALTGTSCGCRRVASLVASAAIRCAPPSDRINRPRSAPACSMAVRRIMSISFSSTISPEAACVTLITVARSSWSTGVAIVFVAPGVAASARRYGCCASSWRAFPSAPQRR